MPSIDYWNTGHFTKQFNWYTGFFRQRRTSQDFHLSILKEYGGFYSVGEQMMDTVSLNGNSLWIDAGRDISELIPINDLISYRRAIISEKWEFIWRSGNVPDYFYKCWMGNGSIYQHSNV